MQGEFTALFSRKRPDHIHTVTNSHLEAAKYNHSLIRQTLSSRGGGGGIGVLLKRRLFISPRPDLSCWSSGTHWPIFVKN